MNAVREAIDRDEAIAAADAVQEALEAQDDVPESAPTVSDPAEDETQNESESPSGATNEELAKRRAAGEKAGIAYTKKIEAIYADEEADLFMCPLCPNVHRGFLNVNDAGRIPEEIVAVVQEFMGVQREADYLPSSSTRTCDVCGGLGKVKSGSRVPNYVTLTCAPCQGTGFVPPPGGSSPGLTLAVPAGAGQDGEQFTAPPTDTDPWGSPRLLENGVENPNYGKMPQFKDPNLA